MALKVKDPNNKAKAVDFGTGYIQSGACDYNNKTSSKGGC